MVEEQKKEEPVVPQKRAAEVKKTKKKKYGIIADIKYKAKAIVKEGSFESLPDPFLRVEFNPHINMSKVNTKIEAIREALKATDKKLSVIVRNFD